MPSCLQKFEEGIFSYIRDDGNELHKVISEYMLYKFTRSFDAKYLRIDRSRLNDSMEAWVYVIIDQSFNANMEGESVYYYTAFKGFACTRAVLTWDNSD